MNDNFKILPGESDVYAAAARFFCDCAANAVRESGFFTVALSGGTTPDGLFSLLAGEYHDRIEWSKGHFFWVDDRCVPPESEYSNFGRAERLLLVNVPAPPPMSGRSRICSPFIAVLSLNNLPVRNSSHHLPDTNRTGGSGKPKTAPRKWIISWNCSAESNPSK